MKNYNITILLQLTALMALIFGTWFLFESVRIQEGLAATPSAQQLDQRLEMSQGSYVKSSFSGPSQISYIAPFITGACSLIMLGAIIFGLVSKRRGSAQPDDARGNSDHGGSRSNEK